MREGQYPSAQGAAFSAGLERPRAVLVAVGLPGKRSCIRSMNCTIGRGPARTEEPLVATGHPARIARTRQRPGRGVLYRDGRGLSVGLIGAGEAPEQTRAHRLRAGLTGMPIAIVRYQKR